MLAHAIEISEKTLPITLPHPWLILTSQLITSVSTNVRASMIFFWHCRKPHKKTRNSTLTKYAYDGHGKISMVWPK